MKEKEQWKEFFAVEREVFYEAHLKETQRLVRDVRTTFAWQCPLSFWGFLVKQIRFLAWKIWFLQGMVLALLCAVFFSIYGMLPNAVPRFLCGCSGVIAVCALPILRRSVRYQMFEVERAARFSVRGGLAAQLLFIGIGDMGMLAALAFLAMRFGTGGRVVFLFGVIPFLTAAVSVLMLWMRKESFVSGRLFLLLCGVSVCTAYEMVETVSRLLPDGIMWFGISYALLCIGIIGWGYRSLFTQEKESLLWKSY